MGKLFGICLIAAICGAAIAQSLPPIFVYVFAVGAAGFIGSIVAFILIKFFGFIRNSLFLGRIGSVKKLQSLTPLPILAPIAHSTRKHASFLLVSSEDASVLALKNIAAGLPPVVVVASESGAEGKSFIAANLALLAAQTRRTLLIDANGGAGSLHHSFAMLGAPGLSDVMMAKVTLEKAISNPVEGKLWLLPVGSAQQDYQLDPLRMKRLAQELSHRYDTIIIDFPHVKNPKTLEFAPAVYLIIREGAKAANIRNFLNSFRPTALILNDVA